MDARKTARMAAVLAGLVAYLGTQPTTPAMDVLHAVTNFPNPFDSRSEATTILYALSAESTVKIRIYDLLGTLVKDYPASQEPAGLKALVWDGTNDAGSKVAKGGYLCVVEVRSDASAVLATRKIGVVH